MASFVDVASGALAKASDVQQILDALKGTIGKGIPVSITNPNDAIAYAFSAKNLDATNSRAGIFYKADGSVLLQIDKNGVQASPDGLAAAAPVLTSSSSIPASQIAAAVWTTFTPTLTQGASITLSTANGRYAQIGKIVVATIDMVTSSAGTAANNIVLGGLPVAAKTATNNPAAGSGRYVIASSAVRHFLHASLFTTTSLVFVEGGSSGIFGVNTALTVASGDFLEFHLIYEAA